ncbi:MAG: heme ABC exporter ATP-binding protein CcmA [Hyphomicrobiales bacterium]|nr:heme ABC exporter ATP-binding protein CcmA [Hyphomicrobiales bacterium]
MKLVIENLNGERSGQPIFSSLNFSLEEGQALVVTGSNGSGKSTLLRVIAGLLNASDGSVLLIDSGQDEGVSPPHEYMHYLGHQNALKLALSVEENLNFWQEFCGIPLIGISEALVKVGLPGIEHLPAAYLSAGQKRRVSIAKLLVSYKPIWVVDEPTSALDKASEVLFAKLIEEHLSSGGMVIAATHQSLGIDSDNNEQIKTLNLDKNRLSSKEQLVD